MTELIKITTNDEGKQLVSARELHEGLEVKSRFADWIKTELANMVLKNMKIIQL